VAAAFLASLDPALRASASIAFDDRARKDWHFVPRTRPGVTFAQLTDAQRVAARRLVRSALSARGMLKVESVMDLDAVLRELEQRSGRSGAGRDPLRYTIAVYGDPASHPWGWKIEGHHVSLNFTLVRGGVAATPSFLGANPAEVGAGAAAGRRVLAMEEDLARELVLSLDDQQRAEAVVAPEAPADILTAPGRDLGAAPPAGLAYSKMTDLQKAFLDRIIREYVENLRAELAEGELNRIERAGRENLRFAWAGATEPGRAHYYRITGPTFIIEYDNTQDGANHVHTVWHDRERDFGHDLLREHLEREHKGEGHEHR
jgi:hypothetical protein